MKTKTSWQVFLDEAPPEPESDFDGWADKSIEQKLEVLAAYYLRSCCEQRRFFEGRLLEVTTGMDAHPDWFGELLLPCLCNSCLSYV